MDKAKLDQQEAKQALSAQKMKKKERVAKALQKEKMTK